VAWGRPRSALDPAPGMGAARASRRGAPRARRRRSRDRRLRSRRARLPAPGS